MNRVDVRPPRVETVAAGTGSLQVVRGIRRSAVCRAFATSPLKLLTPKNHGTAAWIYTASYGGGLVNGDALRLTLDVGTDAAAFLSTQSSTKVYRSPQGTSVRLDALVGERGLLVAAPDPVVCFRGASYHQAQHVDLAADASLVLVDCVSSGRSARGERWSFDRYSSRTMVRQEGRLVFFDGLELASDDGDLPARMGRFDAIAIVTLVGPRVSPYVDRLIAACAELAIAPRADVIVSAARLGAAGAVLRIAGTSVEGVTTTLRSHLGLVPALLGDDPWARKW